MYNFDPATGDVVVDPAGISKVSPLYPSNITVVSGAVQAISDKTNFTPRIGAAYRLSEHSVLRGGYGSIPRAWMVERLDPMAWVATTTSS